jgi:hypothetical protein
MQLLNCTYQRNQAEINAYNYIKTSALAIVNKIIKKEDYVGQKANTILEVNLVADMVYFVGYLKVLNIFLVGATEAETLTIKAKYKFDCVIESMKCKLIDYKPILSYFNITE